MGGDCKVPWPNGGTGHPSDFADHREVSFVNRPFPLLEADAHFSRLRAWGFNCLRLLTTWEAVAHAGPGQYDTAYLDYFTEICRKAGEHGFYVFVDFHQDVWSRMSGGDGAPGWTFDAVGLDFNHFDAAGAALVMQHRYQYPNLVAQTETPANQDGYPSMSWVRNYRMPANAVMWTLFWAGEQVTPPLTEHEIASIVDAYGRDHRFVVQVLAELDVLLKQGGDAGGERLHLRSGFDLVREGAHGGAEETFVFGDGDDLAAFQSLNQDLDIAVRRADALDDVGDGADLIDFIRARFVDGCLVLGGEEDFLVGGERFFKRAHTGFPAHDERGHHMGEDDYVADGHHR